MGTWILKKWRKQDKMIIPSESNSLTCIIQDYDQLLHFQVKASKRSAVNLLVS